MPDFKAGHRCRVQFSINLPLVDGEYTLGADITAPDLSHYYDRLERATNFWIRGSDGAKGLVDLEAKVTLTELKTSGDLV